MGTAEANSPFVVIAAEQMELAGLLRRGNHERKLDWPLDYAVSVEIRGHPWVLLANGPGPRLASEASRAVFSTLRPRAMLSIGLCGGLAHTLARGDIVVGTSIYEFATQRTLPSCTPRSAPPAASGSVLSMDRVVVTIRQKRELSALGCSVVEMESSAIAGAAQDRNVPFFCIRAVSDAAGETLPLDFNRFRDKSGRFHRGCIAAGALMRPLAVPRLIELNRVARAAAESLGEFLVECAF